MSGLTSEQRRVVERLSEIKGERGAVTTWVARGGYSRHVYPVPRTLAKRGLVENICPPHGYWPEWRLTASGRALADLRAAS